MSAGDFERVAAALIGVFAIIAMLLIGFGWPSIAAVLMFAILLAAAALLVRLL